MTETLETSGCADCSEVVSDRERPLLIVDASNVAFGYANSAREAHLSNLLDVIAQISGTGIELKIIADASLRHRIDAKKGYERLVREGTVLQAPAGRPADEFLTLLARKRRDEGQTVRIMTNDLLREHPEVESLRATFLIVQPGEVLFDSSFVELVAKVRHAETPTTAETSPSPHLVLEETSL